jgi:type II secretory pathway component GspD/PulD (secretin)
MHADPGSIAGMIRAGFSSRGRGAAEADRVDAVPERGTNSVVVAAKAEKLAKITELINDLDQESSNTPVQEMIQLEHAQAEDITTVLTQTYRSSRRRGSGTPISFAADSNSNSVVVSASKADLEGIKRMIADLDTVAIDPDEELRVIPLQYIDAQETLEIMSEHLRKAGGRRRRGSSDLKGDVRLQASTTLNALLVSGSGEEIDRIQDTVLKMDKEVQGAGEPKVVQLEHAMASQVANVLTKVFTDPARADRRSRRNPDMVPLIMAEEGTNALVIRARTNDFRLIQDMIQKLDVDMPDTGIDVIPVSRSVDVVSLSRQIANTINRGERLKAQMQRGYVPRQIAIGADERTSTLIVGGSQEMFDTVRSLVEKLESIRPDGGNRGAVVVPVNTLPARDLQRVLEQFIEQQTGRR